MTKMLSMTGPKGRRAILFQRAVQNARRRQASELAAEAPPEAAGRGSLPAPLPAGSANDMKGMQARLEAAFDGAA
jgi:hypothetical protein